MFKKISRHKLLLLAFVITGWIYADSKEQNNLLLKKLEQQVLSNFDWECESIHHDNKTSFVQACINQQRNMKELSKIKAVFGIFQKSYPFQADTGIIAERTWDDINLFRDLKNKKALNIAQKIDRTHTYSGKVELYKMLACPTDDIEILSKRSSSLKILVQNSDLFDKLESSLIKLKNYENLTLSFYTNDIFRDLTKEFYTNFDKLNQNEISLGLHAVLGQQKRMLLLFAKAAATAILPYYGISKFNQAGSKSYENILQGSLSILTAGTFAFGLKNDYEAMQEKFAILEFINEKIKHFTAYVETVIELKAILINYPELYNESGLTALDVLEVENYQLNKFMNLLKTNIFKDKKTKFANWGKLLLAYKLIGELKDKFMPILCVAGKVDTLMSCAKLYKEHENKKAEYSFVDYARSENQKIILNDFWHPILDEAKVVTNSISIGAQINDPNNIVITGLNKGGKSTLLKSIITSLLFAQTICVVPAQYMLMTPFAKIGTYINITDNLHSGESLLSSQALAAHGLIKTAQELKAGQFGFTAFDEPFNGTESLTAQAIAYSVAKNMALNKNNICIISTHFPLLGTLEAESNNFLNYKVIEKFVLTKGLSNVNVALDILRSVNFSEDIINGALKVINQNK